MHARFRFNQIFQVKHLIHECVYTVENDHTKTSTVMVTACSPVGGGGGGGGGGGTEREPYYTESGEMTDGC
jgi:hypothetical protein